MTQDATNKRHIVHIIYSLGVGGLENGVVNLINHLPSNQFRHTIICLTHATEFKQRIKLTGVQVHELNKKPGHDIASFFKMYRLLKQLKPDIVHSRNLAAMEYQLAAFCAGVKYRLHGEHGWDVFDPLGENKKYQWLRKMFSLIIHRFVPLSKHLEAYLQQRVGVTATKTARICNGVDSQKFHPGSRPVQLADCPFDFEQQPVIIGTVGRMHGVKDQMTLAKAFARLVEQQPQLRDKARLVMIGDGPIMTEVNDFLEAKELCEVAWLPGQRDDISDLMRIMDIFVLPSTAEGISNTILEAMSSGLPVVATNVGGNPELVELDSTGYLVEKGDFAAMAEKLAYYITHPSVRKQHGDNARARVLGNFSIDVMIEKYTRLYNDG